MPTTHPVLIDDQPAWRKRYGRGGRRVRLAVLDVVARGLGLAPLRPPPHHGGAQAKGVEKQRLLTLQQARVRVPQILDEDIDTLVLSDLGPTLSTCLREAAGDAARTDALMGAAVDAIGRAHANGAYLGQPWPRNLTCGPAGIGFLDFEEDPLEVMPLAQAQSRDWLLFVHGAIRYYDTRPQALQRLLAPQLARADAQAVRGLAEVAARLRPLARVSRRLGTSGKRFAHALRVIRSATPVWLLALCVLLGLDWVDDGQITLFLDDLL